LDEFVYNRKDSLKGDVRRLLACTNINEGELLINALRVKALNKKCVGLFPKQNGGKNEDHNSYKLDDLHKNNINIITNHNGCRGQDYLEVVLLLNPNERYLRQYVVEIIARAICNLVLIVPYPYEQEVSEYESNSSVRDMIHALEHSPDLVDVVSYVVDNSNSAKKLTKETNPKHRKIAVKHKDFNKYEPQKELFQFQNNNENEVMNPSSIGKPRKVTSLKCTELAPDKVQLSWIAESSRYIIHKSVISGD